jgi:hypothetical protein
MTWISMHILKGEGRGRVGFILESVWASVLRGMRGYEAGILGLGLGWRVAFIGIGTGTLRVREDITNYKQILQPFSGLLLR